MTIAIVDPTLRIAGPWDRRAETDFRVEWFSGSGKGGSHRNKHQNSCRVIHVPTGLVEARQGRERVDNHNDAKQALLRRLDEMAMGATSNIVSAERKQMVGSGQRGDKVRTISVQKGQAVDHRTGKRIPAASYFNGEMDRLW